jgi:hypothetical protein
LDNVDLLFATAVHPSFKIAYFRKHFSDKTEKVLGVLKEKLDEILQLSPSEPTPNPNYSVTKNFWDSDDEEDEVNESQN